MRTNTVITASAWEPKHGDPLRAAVSYSVVAGSRDHVGPMDKSNCQPRAIAEKFRNNDGVTIFSLSQIIEINNPYP
jgi:hypothetical protein